MNRSGQMSNLLQMNDIEVLSWTMRVVCVMVSNLLRRIHLPNCLARWKVFVENGLRRLALQIWMIIKSADHWD
jgi:hypothetical protein